MDVRIDIAAVEQKPKPTFSDELEELLHRFGKEKPSDTPDFILANYLINCLKAFNTAHKRRTEWHINSDD